MRKFILILSLVAIFASCKRSDTVVISKEEYNNLKGDTIKPKYPKPFELFPDGLSNYDEGVVLGSDHHEYLITAFKTSSRSVEHYVDCELCLTRKKEEFEELKYLISTLKDSL